MTTAEKALRAMKKMTFILMIFLGLFAGCAAAGALTGCTAEIATVKEAPKSDAGNACTICLGARYIVNDALECVGTEIPCDPCYKSADVAACRHCLDYPPRGEQGTTACETAPGPAGSSCCFTAPVATYFDGVAEISAPAAPVVNGAVQPVYE